MSELACVFQRPVFDQESCSCFVCPSRVCRSNLVIHIQVEASA